MNEKKQYCGLDLLKFIMAVLVAARHMIQVFYPAESRWRLVIGSWLSNLAVPIFFIIAGFLLFRKIPDSRRCKDAALRCLPCQSVRFRVMRCRRERPSPDARHTFRLR